MLEGLTVNQCMAARYLHADGWSWEQLEDLLEVSNEGLQNHLDGECDHPDLDEPMPPDGLSGSEIRTMRLDAGLTQGELAGELDVAIPTVSNWETGKKTPRRWRVRQIREVLDAGGVP